MAAPELGGWDALPGDRRLKGAHSSHVLGSWRRRSFVPPLSKSSSSSAKMHGSRDQRETGVGAAMHLRCLQRWFEVTGNYTAAFSLPVQWAWELCVPCKARGIPIQGYKPAPSVRGKSLCLHSDAGCVARSSHRIQTWEKPTSTQRCRMRCQIQSPYPDLASSSTSVSWVKQALSVPQWLGMSVLLCDSVSPAVRRGK